MMKVLICAATNLLTNLSKSNQFLKIARSRIFKPLGGPEMGSETTRSKNWGALKYRDASIKAALWWNMIMTDLEC